MHQHPYYRGARGEKRDRKRQKKIFKEIIAENFSNMGKEPLTQIQKVQQYHIKLKEEHFKTHINQTDQN